MENIILQCKRNSSLSKAAIIDAMVKHLLAYNNQKVVKWNKVTVSFIEGFKRYLSSNKNISVNSAASYFNAFKTIVKYCYQEGIIDNYRVVLIKGLSHETTERESLTKQELQRLLFTNIDDHYFQTLKIIAGISLATGLRYSDVIQLTENNLQFNSNYDCFVLKVRQEKTGKLILIPVSEKTINTLKKGFEIGLDLDYFKADEVLKKWFKVAKIERRKAHFHIFRHTFASLQVSSGTDILTIQSLMGHKSVTTTMLYANASIEAKKKAMLSL